MRILRRLVVLFAIASVVLACSGPSPWKTNQDRRGHQEYLTEVHNRDVFIENYNEKYQRTERIDDCSNAELSAETAAFFYGGVIASISAGETTNAVGGSLNRDSDRLIGELLAVSDWMDQNYCDGTGE